MKNKIMMLFASILFIAGLSASTPSNGPEPAGLQAEISIVDDFRVRLSGQNKTGREIQINLYANEDGYFGYENQTLVYSDKLDSHPVDFNRVLNLSQLEDGVYEIEIKAGKERFTRRFEIRRKPAEPAITPRTIVLR